MTEGLAAQISTIVRQHLVDAHRMLGRLIDRLDDVGDLGGRETGGASGVSIRSDENAAIAMPSPSPTPAQTENLPDPGGLGAPSAKPSTIERRERAHRAKLKRQRQANGAARAPQAPADPWAELRTELHAAMRARHVTRDQVAAEFHVSRSSICGWLLKTGKPPGAANIARIRAWLAAETAPKPETQTGSAPDDSRRPVEDGADWPELRERLGDVIKARALSHAEVAGVFGVERATVGTWVSKSHEDRAPGPRFQLQIAQWLHEGAVVPAPTVTDAPIYTLSAEERDRLTGHLSLASNAHELREAFGATRELLEKAASGEHLAGDVIARLRATLANGAAAEGP